jgi:hypothetical protein
MTPEIQKLIKLCRMLSSDHDHEALAAARRIHSLIVTEDLDWAQLLANGASMALTQEQIAKVYGAGIARGEGIGYQRGVLDAKAGTAKGPTIDLEDDAVWAERVLSKAAGNSQLSEWERDEFSPDMLARVRKWGRGARISQKQWNIIRSVEGKLKRLGQL